MQKPISIGVYQKGKIISATTQLQVIYDINEIPNLETKLNQGHVLTVDDQYVYKTNVVFVGVEINEITDLDFKKLTHKLDFYLWFRFQGDMNTQNIKFFNAAEPINIGEPIAVEKVASANRCVIIVFQLVKPFFTKGRAVILCLLL
jgi:branched-chain amino acid transport system substrate-binding protein